MISTSTLLQEWDSQFLNVITQAYKTMLKSNNNNHDESNHHSSSGCISEWTLMNQIAEQVAEITSSSYALILKKVYPGQHDRAGCDTQPPPSLAAIGLAGWHRVTAKDQNITIPPKLIFRTQGSHALFVTAFLENRHVVCNEMPPRGNKPTAHPDLENVICSPICYGTEPIGVLIIADRHGGYNEEMTRPMTCLCNSLAHIIKVLELHCGSEDSESSEESSDTQSHTGGSNNQSCPHLSNNTARVDMEGKFEKENELLKSAELSLALFKAVQDSIIVLDKDLCITSMNPSAKDFFNYQPGQKNAHISELIPDNIEQQLFWSNFTQKQGIIGFKGKALAKRRIAEIANVSSAIHPPQTMTEANTTYNFEYVLTPIALSVSSFFFRKEPYFAITIADESTKEELKDKIKFLAFLSHELRNPIQVIISGIHALIDSANCEDTSVIASLYSSVEFITHLLNDMIDLSQLQSGHLKLCESSFNLREKLEQIMNMSYFHQNDKLKIYLSIDDNVPNTIYSDATKFQQIISNILTNSCKYTKQGSVHLKCSFNEHVSPPLINFEISDTGVGIAPSEISLLFNLFRRLDKTQSETIGSGIGLALSKLLCDILGYTISVQSQLGVGTKFTVSVPYKPEEKLTCTRFANKSSQTNTIEHKRVLLVDDNEIIRKSLKNMLRHCVCEEAENGAEAVHKCETNQYDFIVMDDIMPVMRGCDAIRVLRCEKGLKTPIIALTGNSLQNEVAELERAGVDKVLLKPITRSELMSVLCQLLP
ncbi:hypothetical protein C9374_009980 [Naegleria lovaniensis]|uniref:histidine kinase n=1 Tax=Naegleria lovaniensis TaxID=51637 RepID=A0AA88GGW2_NAELO|nr:uncharacterized protein C9374_009980 [Naegleria lovaniensis]KAG2375357.1 hypothetical protein C9374_009980 [Naegleria lovaniensis]